MYGSSRYCLRSPLGGSQHPQQLPQHWRHLKHEQQHDLAQHAQRMMHHSTEKMMIPPRIMSPITNHLNSNASAIYPKLGGKENNLLAIGFRHAAVPTGECCPDISNLSLKISPHESRMNCASQQVQEPFPYTPPHSHIYRRHLALSQI